MRAFYNARPYPPPVENLDDYSRIWQDENRRRADFHLYWSALPYRENLTVLVAGCGTSQAVKHALRQPASRVVGIDISETSIWHTEKLKQKYKLENLETHQLPIERVGELGYSFDKIICTGVLHHLPDPDAGLRALREVLKPEGALHLMVYATYGRAGVYMLQEYARLLEIGNTDVEITDFANTLMELPREHPLAWLLGQSPDFRTKAGLADALLNPQDRAYTVPQLFDFLRGAGLDFGRWVRQAAYLPHCGALAATKHKTRLAQLPEEKQYAASELFRGTMLRHSLIAYRDDALGERHPVRFDGDAWLSYIPIRLPETIIVRKNLPAGAKAVLINQNHTYTDLILAVDKVQLDLFKAIDNKLDISGIICRIEDAKNGERVRVFFEQLWYYDLVVFKSDTTDQVKPIQRR